jgi:hypothetical protein
LCGRLYEADRAATLAEEEALRASLRASIAKLKAQQPLHATDGTAVLSCGAERAATLACYREHPTEPLKCRSAVEQFMACSRNARQTDPSLADAMG